MKQLVTRTHRVCYLGTTPRPIASRLIRAGFLAVSLVCSGTVSAQVGPGDFVDLLLGTAINGKPVRSLLFDPHTAMFSPNGMINQLNNTNSIVTRDIPLILTEARGIPNLVKTALGNGHTIRAWLNHVMGPTWTADTSSGGLPGLKVWNLESIYNQAVKIPQVKTQVDKIPGVVTEVNKIPNIQSAIDALPTVADIMKAPVTTPGSEGQTLNRGIHTIWTNTNQIRNTDVPALQSTLTSVKTELDKLKNLPAKTNDVLAELDGVQELFARIAGIADALPEGLTDDLLESVQAAGALLEVIRSQAQEAVANKDNHPDPVALVNATVGLMNALKGGVGPDANLQVIVQLLNVLPEKFFAVLGQGLLLAGVDQAFIAQLDQLVQDVPLMHQVVALANSEVDATVPVQMQFAPSAVDGAVRAQGPAGAAAVLGVPTSCQDLTRNRTTYAVIFSTASALGLASRVIGAGLKAYGEATVDETMVGVHGYANFKLNVSPARKIGEGLDGVGELVLGLADAASAVLRRCESVLKQNDILANQSMLMQQNCYMTRNRAPGCPVSGS